MPTIYQLTSEYRQLLEMLSDPDYADYEEAVRETLVIKKDELEAKADACMYVARQLEADAETLRLEEERLSARRKAAESGVKRIMKSIEAAMNETGIKRFRTLMFSYWIQNNPPTLDVWDEKQIPEEYFIPQPPKLDRERLRRDIMSGKPVIGARISRGESIRIR